MVSNELVTLGDFQFKIYIEQEEIYLKVKDLAYKINAHFQDEMPVVIVLMNGACFFAIDLLRQLNFMPIVHFIKASSYLGMDTTGEVTFDNMDNLSLEGRSVLIIEDIIDTGTTMHHFQQLLHELGVLKISIASLLVKPAKLKFHIDIDFIGFTISDEFVIGYGLDYNNRGRNLREIYQLVQ